MTATALFYVIGYLLAAIVLVIFSLRVRKVYLSDHGATFRFIYVGCALLALSLVLYAVPYGFTDTRILTVLNFLADTTLMLGLFFVSRFPLYVWGTRLQQRALFNWIQWVILALIGFTLLVTLVQYATGTRALVELRRGSVYVDHAPLLFNVVKIGLILFGGVSSGLTNIYYGEEDRSLRSYLLGLGITILTIGGAITVYSNHPQLAYIADIFYVVGGVSLVAGLLTPRRGAQPTPPPPPTEPQPPPDPFELQ